MESGIISYIFDLLFITKQSFFMAKNATKGAPATAPQKTSDKKSEKLKGKNIDTAAKKAKSEDAEEESAPRETKYVYPADCKTASAKKDFRRKYRAKRDQLHKKIEALKGKKDEESIAARKGLQKEYDKWNADHLNEGKTPYPAEA